MERKTTKRAAAAVAFAATLTGGAVVGAMLGTPTTSGAQSTTSESTTTTTAPDKAPDEEHGPEGHFGFGFGGFDLSAAAKALDLTEAELRTKLENGDTLAEIAKAQGVSEADLVAALVKAGREAIDKAAADAKANLEDRITDLVENGFPDKGEFPGGFGHGHFGLGRPDLAVAARALGISEDELHQRLRDGDSIADIAKAEGADVDKVVTALVNAVNAEIDKRVAAGDLDADRAAEVKSRVEEMIKSFVERGLPDFPGERPHR